MDNALGCLVIFISSIVLYFIPTIVAFAAHSVNVLAIFLTNLLLGWTLIGWVIALIWAVVK